MAEADSPRRLRKCSNFLHPCSGIKRWLILLFTVLGFVAIASAPVLIIRYAVIPKIKATIEDARLDTFQFGSSRQGGGSVFSYNISVAVAIRNSNKVMRIRYTEPLLATFVFHDRRLTNATVVDKGQTHAMGKTRVHPVHATGEMPLFLLGAAAEDDFKKQNATGLFKVEVRLSGKITYQEVEAIAMKRTLSMSCQLGLQQAPPGPEVVVFQRVNCKPVDKDMIYF